MKLSILCAVTLALGLSLMANSTPSLHAASAAQPAASRVDDPPPEPIECPMCGGNAQLHARRMLAVQQQMDIVATLATRW